MTRTLLLSLLALSTFTACRGDDEEEDVVDADGDGHDDSVDCDDADAAVNPAAAELCNGVDDDCSGVVDDIADGAGTTFYADADGDGHGDAAKASEGCEAPDGYVAESDDCNDLDPEIYPGAPEEDCTDATDYNCDGSVGFADADSDGTPACEDCDDSNAAASPDGAEVCDGADNDCDGAVDNDASDAQTFYADSDADGFGDESDTQSACEAPSGYISQGGDCNDLDANISPDADELCNSVDDDCDGTLDESAVDVKTFYADADGDGAGGSNVTVTGCEAPTGFTDAATDCDDLDPTSYPGADEVCDAKDNDCDGSVPADEQDGDNDGVSTCDGDCDDAAATRYPGAAELCDGEDNDCNGSVPANEQDSDADGVRVCGGDCNDSAATTNPGADELCDGNDNDCDGQVDNDPVDPDTFYVDVDGDGFGDVGLSAQDCAAPDGYVDNDDDCDDDDATIYTGAPEQCDFVDADCDGVIDGDKDDDGFLSNECDGGFDCDDTDDTLTPDEGCSIHATEPFSHTNTASGCSYENAHAVKWANLGNMSWKACMAEASRRGVMVYSNVYSVREGWAGHRNGSSAMLSYWSSYKQAGINESHPCVVGRGPNATRTDDELTQQRAYDGDVWHYEDLGSMHYDECQKAAGNASASIITPAVFGESADNYWVNSVHACNTYQWIINGGTAYRSDNIGVGQRSSQRSCMIGYMASEPQ